MGEEPRHVAGPDGKIGTGDDIADPFTRVVKPGSPYAVAMGEDKIVDAKLDMRVADATVEAWSSLLTEFTGTRLSATGDGIGSGHGRLGGSHRAKAPSGRMGATSVSRPFGTHELSAPVRTDGHGVAHLHVPLGADETTYRVMHRRDARQGGPCGYVHGRSGDAPRFRSASTEVRNGSAVTRRSST